MVDVTRHIGMADARFWNTLVIPCVHKRDNYQCVICKKENTLEVHHIKYGKEIMDCTIKDLITLCRSCHQLCHRICKGNRQTNEVKRKLEIIKSKGLLFREAI